ncbi:hypothetical protein [Microcoleus sp.]
MPVPKQVIENGAISQLHPFFKLAVKIWYFFFIARIIPTSN